MYLGHLRLFQFKNHFESDFELHPKINCFVGNNGVGKTNVLDALYYLSLGKSFIQSSDNQNISFESDAFFIQAKLCSENKTEEISVHYSLNSKKTIKRNNKNYARIADYIGVLPSVIISPYDSNLISDSGESRRKFLDSLICQISPEYLQHLISYNKALQQRNALLKYFQKNKTFDLESLEIYNFPIVEHSAEIFRKRNIFIDELSPIVAYYYGVLSQKREQISITYFSDLLEKSTEELLSENLNKDRALTYTSKGVHKDDVFFEINGYMIKKMGSQGQQKSFLIALKLAQLQLMKTHLNKNPILLLDDIFDKLDDNRVGQLISLVNDANFGQIFLTDTHHDRTEKVVKQIHEESKIFNL